MSYLEDQLVLQIRAMKLPEPEREVMLIPGRRFRFDLVWRARKVAVEVQGGIWVKSGHTTGKGLNRDFEKHNLATLEGYRVLPISKDHITSGKAIEWIGKALQ